MERFQAPPLPHWLESQLPFARYRVPIAPYAMHVMEQGEGADVVLVHGNPTWGYLWRRVARALESAALRLVMPDLVGLGLSDKPPDAGGHSLELHQRSMAALLREVAPQRYFLVVQDWGGPIGVGATAPRGDDLRGLVVLNTVLGPPRPGFRPTLFHRFARVPLASELAFRVAGFPQRGMWVAQGDKASIHGEVARAYVWPLRHFADRAAPLALARMVPDSQAHPSIPALERCQAFVSTFRRPTAVVWGDKDPVLGRARSRVERMLPHASVRRTAAGHFLQEEVPDVIADAVREVVTRAVRSELCELLDRHTPQDAKERDDLASMKAHATALGEPLARQQPRAHFTGSAVVATADGSRVCLVHHARLSRWLQPGGHAEPKDGGELWRTALREAREETGLALTLAGPGRAALDLDAHLIPAGKDGPAHHHLDVRFLCVAQNPEALRHDPAESHGAQWLAWDEALTRADEPALRRLLSKARAALGRS